MKRIIALLALLVVAAAISASAQSDIIIKQKAKNLPGANNPPPAPRPPATPGAPGTPAAPTAPPTPSLSPEKQAQFDKMTADLSAIQPGSTVTADQKQNLENDVLTVANTGAKPTKPLVTKLSADLSSALAGKAVKAADHVQLVKSVNVIVNSGKLTSAQTQPYVTTVQTTLKNAGAADADIQNVVASLNAIVAELQKGKPSLYK
jgi:hypothetical protein